MPQENRAGMYSARSISFPAASALNTIILRHVKVSGVMDGQLSLPW